MRKGKKRVWLIIISILLVFVLAAGAILLWIFWDDITGKAPDELVGEVEVDPGGIFFWDDGAANPAPVMYQVGYDVDYLVQHGAPPGDLKSLVEFHTVKAEYSAGETVYFEGKILDTGTFSYAGARFPGVEDAMIILTSDGAEFCGEFTMPAGDVIVTIEII